MSLATLLLWREREGTLGKMEARARGSKGARGWGLNRWRQALGSMAGGWRTGISAAHVPHGRCCTPLYHFLGMLLLPPESAEDGDGSSSSAATIRYYEAATAGEYCLGVAM